jgi:hypothetical protein
MVKRVTPWELVKVRRLLAAQWRFVEIARELELSLWTVQRIANDADLQVDPLPECALPVDDAPPDYVAADLRRCPGCGGMVYHWPCIACEALNGPRVPPAPEAVDELVDRVGWDMAEISRCGRRRRTKGNAAYRAKLARRGGQEHRS